MVSKFAAMSSRRAFSTGPTGPSTAALLIATTSSHVSSASGARVPAKTSAAAEGSDRSTRTLNRCGADRENSRTVHPRFRYSSHIAAPSPRDPPVMRASPKSSAPWSTIQPLRGDRGAVPQAHRSLPAAIRFEPCQICRRPIPGPPAVSTVRTMNAEQAAAVRTRPLQPLGGDEGLGAELLGSLAGSPTCSFHTWCDIVCRAGATACRGSSRTRSRTRWRRWRSARTS